MKTGEIDLALLAGKTDEEKGKEIKQEPGPAAEPLGIHKPGSTAIHPVQTIIETLLRWFAAYYALESAKAKRPQSDASGSPAEDSGLTIEVSEDFLAMMDEIDQPTSDPAAHSKLSADPPVSTGLFQSIWTLRRRSRLTRQFSSYSRTSSGKSKTGQQMTRE